MYAHPQIGRSVNRSEINAQARLCYPRHRQCQWATCLGAIRRLERDCRDPVRDHCADGAPRSPRAGARRGRCAAPLPQSPCKSRRGEATALRFSGDLRYRHESINEDTIGERHRQRLRARFGLTADVTDDVRVGLTLATGGDDPVSANQTLDGGFSREELRRGPRILHLASDRSSELHGRQDGDAVLQAG